MNPQHQRGCANHSGQPARHAHDKAVFHALLDRHQSITRQVEKLGNGMRAVTRSDDPEVVALLHDHVPAMHQRLMSGQALRRWDPLYPTLFEHADVIDMHISLLADGVEVVEVSDAPYVASLIQAHADAVDAFVARGFSAAQQPSPMPVLAG